MAADAAAPDRFDAFLDDLARGFPTAGHRVDPRLSATTRTLHAAASAQSPDPAFASHLRRSLVSQPAPEFNGDRLGTSDSPRSPRPHRFVARGRRVFLTEWAAIAAVALLLIVGLGVTGRLSLPAWFDDDEPSHLAAPSIATQDLTPTPAGTAAWNQSGEMVAQVSLSSESEEGDPFPIGSTVVVTTDLLNLRSEPTIRYENVISVLHTGDKIVVRGSAIEVDGQFWLPVRDEETGAVGYIMVDFVEASPATIAPSAHDATPEPGSAAILFILDKSGSMSYDPLGQTSKLEWEKETIRRALDELPVGGQLGVLVFNDQYMLAVPMTHIESDADRDTVASIIDAITADGGSELAPALRAGLDMLNLTNAATKHAVLLTDGKSRDNVPSELQRLVEAAHAEGIDFSVIAMGDDADTVLLRFLAETGGGRYHLITSSTDIPVVTVEGTEVTLLLPATPVASPVLATPTSP